jgi:hypothetical protein
LKEEEQAVYEKVLHSHKKTPDEWLFEDWGSGPFAVSIWWYPETGQGFLMSYLCKWLHCTMQSQLSQDWKVYFAYTLSWQLHLLYISIILTEWHFPLSTDRSWDISSSLSLI